MREIDINQVYFFMPFGPINPHYKKYGLRFCEENFYYHKKTNSKWRKVLLYNVGWGRPDGYERLPELSFDELMYLALWSDPKTTRLKVSEEESNKYGAISVIMERHIDSLVEYLQHNIDNEKLFSNSIVLDNLKLFCFDSSYSRTLGGCGLKSYEDMLKENSKWNQISSKICSLIYE